MENKSVCRTTEVRFHCFFLLLPFFRGETQLYILMVYCVPPLVGWYKSLSLSLGERDCESIRVYLVTYKRRNHNRLVLSTVLSFGVLPVIAGRSYRAHLNGSNLRASIEKDGFYCAFTVIIQFFGSQIPRNCASTRELIGLSLRGYQSLILI